MALTETDIRERRELIVTEIQSMQNRLAELDREKTNAIANMNALRGAQQQCEFFLETLDSEGDLSAAIAPGVPTKEKKVTKTSKEENGKDE